MNAVKPAGWLDDGEPRIPDPSVSKPAEWVDEEDGDWEHPMIDNPVCEDIGCGEWVRPQKPNPLYKGKWSAPLIDNPAYRGVWAPRKIPNPNFFVDNEPHRMQPMVHALPSSLLRRVLCIYMVYVIY